MKDFKVNLYAHPELVWYGISKMGLFPVKFLSKENTVNNKEVSAALLDAANYGLVFENSAEEISNVISTADVSWLRWVVTLIESKKGIRVGRTLFGDHLKVTKIVDEDVLRFLTTLHYISTYGSPNPEETAWFFGKEPPKDVLKAVTDAVTAKDVMRVRLVGYNDFIIQVVNEISGTGENNKRLLEDVSNIVVPLVAEGIIDEGPVIKNRELVSRLIKKVISTFFKSSREEVTERLLKNADISWKTLRRLLRDINIPLANLAKSQPRYAKEVILVIQGVIKSISRNHSIEEFLEEYHRDNNSSRYLRRFFAIVEDVEKTFGLKFFCLHTPKIRRFINENVRRHGHKYSKPNKLDKVMHRHKEKGLWMSLPKEAKENPTYVLANIGPAVLKAVGPSYLIRDIANTTYFSDRRNLLYLIRLYNYFTRVLNGSTSSGITFIRDNAVFTPERTYQKFDRVGFGKHHLKILEKEIYKRLNLLVEEELGKIDEDIRSELLASLQDEDYFPKHSKLLLIPTTRLTIGNSYLVGFGSYYEFPVKERILHHGVFWENSQSGKCVDIDLHADLVKEDLSTIHVGWHSSYSLGTFVSFSGDMTCADKKLGAAEFISIDLESDIDKVNYAILSLTLYSSFSRKFDFPYGMFFHSTDSGNKPWKSLRRSMSEVTTIPAYLNKSLNGYTSSTILDLTRTKKRIARVYLAVPTKMNENQEELMTALIGYTKGLKDGVSFNKLVEKYPWIKEEVDFNTLTKIVYRGLRSPS